MSPSFNNFISFALPIRLCSHTYSVNHKSFLSLSLELFFAIQLVTQESLASQDLKCAIVVAFYRRHFYDSFKGWGVSFSISVIIWLLSGLGEFWPVWVLLYAVISMFFSFCRLRGYVANGVSLPDRYILAELDRFRS